MSNISSRVIYLISFLTVVILLTVTTFLQIYEGVTPCPLCITQRYVMCILGILFFIGTLFQLKKWRAFMVGLLSFLTTIAGLLLSGRQAWLQHYPPQGFGDCGVSLDFMLKMLSFREVIQKVWEGGTECSRVGEAFLYLSLAEWSFIWFGVFFVVTLVLLKRALLKD